VSMVGTSAGLPDISTTLATTTVPASHWMLAGDGFEEWGSYRYVAFAPFAVTSGDQIAITVRRATTNDPFDYLYWYGSGDYAGGQAFSWDAAAGHWTSVVGNHGATIEFAFRSYVDLEPPPPVGVPTPARRCSCWA